MGKIIGTASERRITINGEALNPRSSQAVCKYAETFFWGDVTPPSLQTALALMLHYTRSKETAASLHSLFLHKFIINLPADCNWELEEEIVCDWIAEQRLAGIR
jgi:hypothetical protein